ncbi:response regulator [Candidatus Omnitrophota bacterium]
MYKILVVDDEVEIVKILQEFLTKAGHEVVIAIGGAKAVGRINSKTVFDLMVLDLKMAQIDGIGVLREMKKLNKQIPTIILSGSMGLSSHIDDLSNLGFAMSDVLYKPIDLTLLLGEIEKKLSKK